MVEIRFTERVLGCFTLAYYHDILYSRAHLCVFFRILTQLEVIELGYSVNFRVGGARNIFNWS